MKATMVVSATDKVRFLIEQYSDSSYNDEKFEGAFISDDLNVTDSKDKLLLGVLSYVFFGRSFEMFNVLLQTFLIKKTREDLSSSITSELVTNSTEKRLFNKVTDLEPTNR